MPTKFQEIKTPTGKTIVLGYEKPPLPAVHRVSEAIRLLGNFAQLTTGQHWTETALQNYFEKIAERCSPARAALNQAESMRLDANMKPDVAAVQLAERRRAVVEPVLSEIANLSAAEIEKAFGSIDDLEKLVLELSQPAPVAGESLIARKIETAAMMPVVLDARADGRKLSELVGNILKTSRLDLLEWAESIAPVLGISFDFPKMRREWAVSRWPELQTLIDTRQLIAEKVWGCCSAVFGFANLAMNRAVLAGFEQTDFQSAKAYEEVEALAELSRPVTFEKFAPIAGQLRESAREEHGAGLAGRVRGQG